MTDEQFEDMMSLLGAIQINTARCYDVLMAMLPDSIEQELDSVHTQGKLVFSPPTLVENAWGTESDEESPKKD